MRGPREATGDEAVEFGEGERQCVLGAGREGGREAVVFVGACRGGEAARIHHARDND